MRYSEEELLQGLRDLATELKKAPTARECNECSYTPNQSTYKTRFGSWNKAKEAAGLTNFNKFGVKTDKELIDSLKNFYNAYKRSPTQKECRNENNLFGVNTYKDRFGGWEEALNAAGLTKNILNSTQETDEILLDLLKEFYLKNGKAPTHADCNNRYTNLKSHMVYTRRFGSYNNALKLANIPLNGNNPELLKTSTEDLLGTIKRFYKENDRAPTQEDCTNTPYLKSHATYYKRFGTFLKAIDQAKVPRNPANSSVGEQEIFKFIENNYKGIVKNNDSSILPSRKELDIVLPDLKLSIEFNGLYWHSQSVKADKNYHLNKTVEAEKAGYRLIHIFENEWANKKEIVKSRLSNLLGKSKRIYARKCTVKEVSSPEAKSFLDTSHIQGNANASIKLGLYFEDELVAIQTFCKSRFSKNYEWELLRYCNKLNTSVVGGASKLFKYFIKTYNPNSIVSYSDIRWSSGTLYTNLGFEHSHDSSPNYWYFKGLNLESRVKYQKHKLAKVLSVFDESKTEYENMLENGYKRIFDCGNKVYKWEASFSEP